MTNRSLLFAVSVAAMAVAVLAGCGGDMKAPEHPTSSSPPAPPQAYPMEPAQEEIAATGKSADTDRPRGGVPVLPSQRPESTRTTADATNERPTSAQGTAQAPGATVSGAGGGSSNRLREASIAFDRVARELEAGLGQCSVVCRSLASMERSASHLCALALADRQESLCTDAAARVRAARARVRASCGSCPGGPTLDPDAPLPADRP
ncbi:MAG: hypothetical protein U0169_18280 [Polyangiaceae bacterium]